WHGGAQMPIRRLVITSLLGAAVITAAGVWWRTAEDSTRHAGASVARRVSLRDPISRVAATADGWSTPVLGLHMDARSFSSRGRFHDASGSAYTIGEARRTDRAAECVVVIGPATSSACDEPRLFSRGPVMFIEGFEGGPAPQQRTGETVSGIAAPAVSGIIVVESRSEERRVGKECRARGAAHGENRKYGSKSQDAQERCGQADSGLT